MKIYISFDIPGLSCTGYVSISLQLHHSEDPIISEPKFLAVGMPQESITYSERYDDDEFEYRHVAEAHKNDHDQLNQSIPCPNTIFQWDIDFKET